MASWTDHEFYVYALDGLAFMGPPPRRDILATLRQSKTYLVDNNVSWRNLATNNPAFIFVLSGTFAEEVDNLQGALFKNIPLGGFPNVFSVVTNPEDKKYVIFNRIEPNHVATLIEAIPTLAADSPEHHANRVRAAAAFRQHIGLFLSLGGDALRSKLSSLLPRAPSNYEAAGEAAVVATTLFLQKCAESTRSRMLDPGYLNFPGDTRLIAEALFFSFSVISDDVNHVHAIGAIAGVHVVGSSHFNATDAPAMRETEMEARRAITLPNLANQGRPHTEEASYQRLRALYTERAKDSFPLMGRGVIPFSPLTPMPGGARVWWSAVDYRKRMQELAETVLAENQQVKDSLTKLRV
jgi:hypothetical protein